MPTKTPTTSAASLQTVLDAIANDEALPLQRRRNICSAIQSVSKLKGLPLGSLPTSPGFHRKMFSGLHPEQCGLSLSRLRNIKSDLLFALRRTGQVKQGHAYGDELSLEWAGLMKRAEGPQRLHRYMSRFIHFCSANGISPENVDDAASEKFRVYLHENSFVTNPAKAHQDICRLWNRATKVIPGWPSQTLAVPRRKVTYTVTEQQYPKPLLREIDVFFDHKAGKNILDDEGPMRPMKARTISSRRYRLRQIVSALVLSGYELEALDSLAKLVDVEAAKTALRFFLNRTGGKTTSQIFTLAIMLKDLGKNWLKVDERHLDQLKAFCRKTNPGNKGLTEKNRDRLRQFDADNNIRLLLEFPRRQIEKTRREDKGRRRDAIAVQTALAVELLLMIPIRAENLIKIDITRHIQRSRTGASGIVHLVIPGEEVKNGEPLEFSLPKETVELLDLYIRDFRPRLINTPVSWLFPGKSQRPKTRELFGDQISKHVYAATGLRINLHLFRHIAAKLYLDRNPGGYEVCRRVLGHRSMDTTTGFYTGMEAAAAVKHFDEEILKLRREVSRRT